MKKCCRCKIEKPSKKFNFKNKAFNIRQKACKTCTRIEIRNHYYKNKNYYLEKTRKANQKNRNFIKKYIWEFLLKNPCIDCGEKNPIVLDFDHQANKTSNISDLVKNRYSFEIVKQEIKKCVIRCANCHRKKTAKDFNWYKGFGFRND